jgi:hypothetical protein
MKETTMTIRHATFTAALALASIGPTQAEGLKPLQGQVIDLGDVSGVAYHTVERETAFASSPPSRKRARTVCVRVEAVLAPDQSLALSTPREAGTPPDAVEIMRRADTVLVHEAAAVATN